MNTERDKIRAMLNEYLDGELPPQQAAEVEAAIAKDEELAAEHADLLATRKAIKSLRNATAPHGMVERIMQVAHHHVFSGHEKPRPNVFGKLFHFQVIAAAAIVLIAVGMGMYVINMLSTSQQAPQKVAINDVPSRGINYDKKIMAAEVRTLNDREEEIAIASLPEEAELARKIPTDGLSKARPVVARKKTREALDKLSGKVLAESFGDEDAEPDFTPAIKPEPSMVLEKDRSGIIKTEVSEYSYSRKSGTKGLDDKIIAMTPPSAPAVPDDSARKVKSFQSVDEKVTVGSSQLGEFEKQDAPAVAIAKEKIPESINAPGGLTVEKAKKPVELAACTSPVESVPARPEAPAAPEVAKAEEPVREAPKKLAPKVCCIEVPAADNRNQNIVIETSNVAETQAKLDKYMKSNNIQVLTVSAPQPVDVVQTRRNNMNRQIQMLDTWADKEPQKLEYHIRTSPQQAGQINVDLAEKFPNMHNVSQTSTRLAAAGYSALERKSSSTETAVTNAADGNPVLMVITIQKRMAASSTLSPLSKPATTSKPSSQPATQPASQPTK